MSVVASGKVEESRLVLLNSFGAHIPAAAESKPAK
jgi:hypothetical protein